MKMIKEGETLQQVMSALAKRCCKSMKELRKATAAKLGTSVAGLKKIDDETVAQAAYAVALENDHVH